MVAGDSDFLLRGFRNSIFHNVVLGAMVATRPKLSDCFGLFSVTLFMFETTKTLLVLFSSNQC